MKWCPATTNPDDKFTNELKVLLVSNRTVRINRKNEWLTTTISIITSVFSIFSVFPSHFVDQFEDALKSINYAYTSFLKDFMKDSDENRWKIMRPSWLYELFILITWERNWKFTHCLYFDQFEKNKAVLGMKPVHITQHGVSVCYVQSNALGVMTQYYCCVIEKYERRVPIHNSTRI